jgi:signal transduction histidine kinase
MAMTVTQPAPNSAADFAVTHPLRPLAKASVLCWFVYGAAAVIVALICRPYVPPLTMTIWVICAAIFMVVWATLNIAIILRRPDARELVLQWSKASRFLGYGATVIVVSALLLFLGHCPRNLQIMLGLFFLNSPSLAVIATPENVTSNRVSIATVGGSLTTWFLIHGDFTQQLFGLFVFAISTGLMILCDVIPKTVAAVVSERIASDDAVYALESANAAVTAERDAKTHFIAAASHDLGQPLQAAALFFDQVVRAPDAASRERAEKGVRRAFASSEQLLGHMLNHLRLEADAVVPQILRVSLGSALSRLAAQFQPSAAAAGITIHVVPTRLSLLIDPALLDRAMGNLISNAITYSRGQRILLGAQTRGEKIRIWVIDDGTGVDTVDADYIFDDYFRGTSTRAATKGGFGLGLASARRIATLFGGHAGLDSRWRCGAAFYLAFPVEPSNIGKVTARAEHRK